MARITGRKDVGRKDKGGDHHDPVVAETLVAGFMPGDLKALMMSVARLADDPDDEALDLAQEKAFEAMEASTAKKRISLAKAALALSPRCADAYLVLAWEEADPDKALDLHRQAVAAGEEAVGAKTFERDVGSFWGLIQTRPYMRARHELAMALWSGGHRDEAVDHYRDMLRLNPNDNQGIRYLLMDALLELGRDPEAAALMKSYKDDGSAAWAWSGALLAFRRAPESPAAHKALVKAQATNPHVAAYLLDLKPLPEDLPKFIRRGEVDEAVAYVHDANPAWCASPGAKTWLAERLARPHPDQDEDRDLTKLPDADPERVDAAVLALLVLGHHGHGRVWKSFDWTALDRLHSRGLISDPASKAKSVVLTEAGLEAAIRSYRTLLAAAS